MCHIRINFYLYIGIKKYFPLLKMAEELIGNLGYETPQSDTKRQKLLKCILTGNSKLYLGKVYMEEQLAKLSEEEVVNQSFICTQWELGSALGIRNQEALSEDLENDPFLNSALQRFTCKLYYRFGSFLAPLSFGIITSRHYLSEHNKNGE